MEQEQRLLAFLLDHLGEEEINRVCGVLRREDPELYKALCTLLRGRRGKNAPKEDLSSFVSRLMEERQEPANKFIQRLDAYIRERGFKDSQVYRKIGMEPNNWSRFKKTSPDGVTRGTSHENFLKLCIVLQLGYYESVAFLALAGRAFSTSLLDRVVAACLARGIYDPDTIDGELCRLNCPALFSLE